ncbi:hypothetical protein DFH08DRAFT_976228 [Mycena albidolilacea]|uniref:Uncharacterized protein n=1 Tax=Mycena albidolilacea TaxID=1033008 RepID=A0AAD6Z317_9AGAR|nr:hypothetical protein DFH08DRAFT_976228 [Mycena albidolilacea]
MFSAALFFCISLNVPLVVVHNVNGQAMEKYCIAATTLICLICTVPPYASGNLGHMGRPQAGFLTSWIMLFAVGEIAAFLIILGYLIAHELHLICRPFRNIILRIGLCPLVSFVLNPTAPAIDLHEFRKYKMEAPEPTKLDMILLLVNIATCDGRSLIYGLLAATDPSFIRAFNALRHPEAESQTQFYGRSYFLSTIVDIPPHETRPYDSDALHNDCARQDQMPAHESPTAPRRDLGMGKRWRPYLGHDTSVSTTRLSISRPAPTLPATDIDFVCHI